MTLRVELQVYEDPANKLMISLSIPDVETVNQVVERLKPILRTAGLG